jgi:hypothetical protein
MAGREFMERGYPADACCVPPRRDLSFRALAQFSLKIWSTNLEMNQKRLLFVSQQKQSSRISNQFWRSVFGNPWPWGFGLFELRKIGGLGVLSGENLL